MSKTLLQLCMLNSIILLSGCATLSKEECVIGNWQAIGYSDGVAGHYPDRLTSHAKACSKASIAPDNQAWEYGRQMGLKQYCTTSNAYSIGRRGTTLNKVCPVTMTNDLQRVNQQGLEYYRLNKQLDDDKRLLEKYRIEYNKLRNGEKLDFKTEKEARERLVYLPKEFQKLTQRIYNNQRQLNSLEQSKKY